MSRDLDKLAASVVMFGFDGLRPTAEAEALCRRGAAGAILFKRNVGKPQETFELTESLRALAADRRFLLAVDQEGGRVARLREGFTALPALRRIGDLGDPLLAEKAGRILGRECRAAGFDIDFAPVLDVDSNPHNPVIGDRSFSRDPQSCAVFGIEMIAGLQAEGVAACGKHFPGHGDTHQDSHRALPRLSHDLARLDAIELPPFRAAVTAGVASLMTAHVVFEALDAELPATLSPQTLGPLRQRIGFDGVLVSDDLEMAAVADLMPVGDAAPLAIAAGCDLLLVCHSAERQAAAIDAIRRYAEEDSGQRARLEQASARVAKLATQFGRAGGGSFDASALRRPEALAFAAAFEQTRAHDPTERTS